MKNPQFLGSAAAILGITTGLTSSVGFAQNDTSTPTKYQSFQVGKFHCQAKSQDASGLYRGVTMLSDSSQDSTATPDSIILAKFARRDAKAPQKWTLKKGNWIKFGKNGLMSQMKFDSLVLDIPSK